MPYQFDAYEAYQKCRDYLTQRFMWCITNVKRKFQEHRTKRKNEAAQDRAARRTANATYWIAGFTFVSVAVNGGVLIVLNNQLVAMRTDGRAWVGPAQRNFIGPLEKGKSAKITISYKNSGKEPATDFQNSAAPILFTQDEWNNGKAAEAITAKRDECFKSKPFRGSGMVFPTDGNTSYGMMSDTSDPGYGDKAIIVTDELISGIKILALTGCYVYQSAEKIRHTSFCFFYQANRSTFPVFSICNLGNDGD